jgi:hypothetical protein
MSYEKTTRKLFLVQNIYSTTKLVNKVKPLFQKAQEYIFKKGLFMNFGEASAACELWDNLSSMKQILH